MRRSLLSECCCLLIRKGRAFSRGLSSNTPVHVCIIGSGPAGFYTAQTLLRNHKNMMVDMIEKLPVPYGLVRYGVAPDHPEVKNVINSFDKVARNPHFHFFGNVIVGDAGANLTLSEIRHLYHAVVLAHGCEGDRQLGIEGEHLAGVVAARRFVGWFNGLPADAKLSPALNESETVAVVGAGNVALDCARMLLTPVDLLRRTDTPEFVLDSLSRSRVRRVVVLARRGPLQCAFTIKEFRELTRLEKCSTNVELEQLRSAGLLEPSVLESLSRPRNRLSQLLIQTADKGAVASNSNVHADHKLFELKFFRVPLRVVGDDRVEALQLGVSRVTESGDTELLSEMSSQILDCQMVLRSVGFLGVPLATELPWERDSGGHLQHRAGRLSLAGLYCAGWAKRGPVGVIQTTLADGAETAHSLLEDLSMGLLSSERMGRSGLQHLLHQRNTRHTSFSDWLRIDESERACGNLLGKPREKITDYDQMLRVAWSS